MSDWKSTALLLGAGVGAYIFIVKPQLDSVGKMFEDTINFIPNAVNDFGKSINVENFTNPVKAQRDYLNTISPYLGDETQNAVIKLIENYGTADVKAPLMLTQEPTFMEQQNQTNFINNSLKNYSTSSSSSVKPISQSQINLNNLATQQKANPQNFITGTLIPKQNNTIMLGNYNTGISTSKSINTSSTPVYTPKLATPPPPTPKVSSGGTFAPSHYAQTAAETARYAAVRANAAILAAKNSTQR